MGKGGERDGNRGSGEKEGEEGKEIPLCFGINYGEMDMVKM